ncbi:hypothetical protein PHYSODRAFT_307641 [Phytophthora sojae]|uniref:Polycystin cation channel PKD1/PKD2 domain-containing protein n=1 Tax=Phytophthora sojae (strain P6497) TaxID=1094619 RepID=G5AFJ1_PHYSP|nr:hypothetical protein PHYSODRAFT_307641 [Phytophthora sojae]EGZ05981.1 hypothetical protein PHYSODRAFT_307641 [Phytophthora sojae]|eukprot:XP_009538842.1 hypothetical protein PHYSODRAFT_307641 [Phytophthora sojae]
MAASIGWAVSRVLIWRNKENRPSRRSMIASVFSLFNIEAVLCVFYAVWATIVNLLNASDFQNAILLFADPVNINEEGSAEAIDSLAIVINDLMRIADKTEVLRAIGAVAIALLCLQMLNRFLFHPQLNILTRTIASALKQFFAFFIVFIVNFTGFTIIGSMIFGDRAKEFSSLANSMIVVGIVLMNMMLAIVLDAYDRVSKESYRKAANLKLANRVLTICWDIVCELRIEMFARGTVVSRGKIRPSVLEWTLKNSKDTHMVTEQTMKELFAHAGDEASIHSIEIVNAVKAGEAGSNGDETITTVNVASRNNA